MYSKKTVNGERKWSIIAKPLTTDGKSEPSSLNPANGHIYANR
jgi:hypothetical protein